MNFAGEKVLNRFFLANSGNTNDIWSILSAAFSYGPLIYQKQKFNNLKRGEVNKLKLSMTLEGSDLGLHERLSHTNGPKQLFYTTLPLKKMDHQWVNHFPVQEVNSADEIQLRLSQLLTIFQ